LKNKATIRAPFSLHFSSKLVSIPFNIKYLDKFNPKKNADPQKVMKEKVKFEIPNNKIELFKFAI